ncbi:amidohydrolase family protein [Amycolatopsis sp.]|jgi:imidazolonepropionase-like amidohydrolase|uniref:amidohydrolase family protein n=1 Tax=Amycolatopsis sp. TaxID=37632 RepID=UPI002DFAEC30|nr:amidohydrolase family protein [Amycolatopsis sp.]
MLALRAARGFDGEQMLADGVTVLVDDGRIVGVESGWPEVGERWQVLEFAGATVLPGLIDTHVHLGGDSENGALERLAEYPGEKLDAVIEAGLRRHVAAGVTTVRDLGDRRWSVLGWRERRRVGEVGFACPTIVASGPPVTSVGGHCWSMGGAVEGAGELIAAVGERAGRGVDVVKVMASGGNATPGTDVMSCQFSLDELKLVVAEGHRLGLPVTAHAHGLTAVEQAIAAGVDGIEHCSCVTETGVEMSDALLGSLADSRILVCPTLGKTPGAAPPPVVVEMMRRTGMTWEARLRLIGRMYEHGVRLVSGTDGGISTGKPHGILPFAIADLVGGGVPVAAALASATSEAASACGLGDRKGRLRPGWDADLLVTDGDPAVDIAALGRVRAVAVGGVVEG